MGPTGTNRVNVRYWRAELGCSEADLRDAVAAVGVQAVDVRRYLDRRRRAPPHHLTQQHTAQR